MYLNPDSITPQQADQIRAEVRAILVGAYSPKTRQELFDTTVRHMARQGAKAVDGVVCCIRDAAGKTCAIGCHIRAEDYRPWMDGGVFVAGVVYGKESNLGILLMGDATRRLAGIAPEDRWLADKLQEVHDNVSEPIWDSRLRDICTRYELSDAVFSEPDVIVGFARARGKSA